MIVVGRFVLGSADPVDWIRVVDGWVAERGSGATPGGPRTEFDGILVPGFVDPHVHGALGVDFASCDADAARRAAAFHIANGSTTLVATLASAPLEHLAAQLATLAPLVADGTLAGLHLEGPFLAPGFRGAHEAALLRVPDADSVRTLVEAGRGALTTVTLAPELPGADEAIRTFVAAGIRVQLGHTGCTAERAAEALQAGASGFTHLCNGMPALAGRMPGPVGAGLLAPDAFVEVIADGEHLADATIDLIRAVAPDRTVLVSDAMAAAGLGDGEHFLAGSRVEVRDGVARTGTGSLAGATVPLAHAVARLVARGVPMDEIVRLTSLNAARALGLPPGLQVGAPADIVQLLGQPDELEVRHVLRRGHAVGIA